MSRFSRPALALLCAVACLAALVLRPSGSRAATAIVVTSTGDGPVAVDGNCTLREAITAANTDAASGDCPAGSGADTVSFDLPGAGPHTVQLAAALPAVAQSVGILNTSGEAVTVRRNTGGNYRVFTISSGVTATISQLTISGGRAGGSNFPDDSGGGILNEGTLTLQGCTVSGNSANSTGGGISNTSPAATLNVQGTTVRDNGAGLEGGGIYNHFGTVTVQNSTVSGNIAFASSQGGGIYNHFGALIIRGSTISGNTADLGGGIHNAGLPNERGALTLENSTVSGNVGELAGGGIYNAGALTIRSSTISGNSTTDAVRPGGGIFNDGAAPAALRNTIVANNSGSPGPDLSGAYGSEGYNLVENTSGATINQTQNAGANITGVDPNLGPLAPNGGPTLTHALLPGSPAIDRGDDGSASPTADQRGLFRPVDLDDATYTDAADASDIGAYELQGAAAGDAAGSVVISEFRARGPGGASDDFFELYNATDSEILVTADDGSAGWALVTRSGDGSAQNSVTIPNGTRIPARSHYLVAGPAYSLSAYAAADHPATLDGFDGGGVALFRSATTFDTNTLLDAVGFTTQTDPLFRGGTGIAWRVTSNVEHSYVRRLDSGRPQYTNDNAADFVLVATNPPAVTGSVLGAPGPENLSSPVQLNERIKASLIDPQQPHGAPPNTVRKLCGQGAEECLANRSAQGTFSIRRRWTNNTGAGVTALRFRIVSMTTDTTPPAGVADLRAISSGQVTGVAVTGGGSVTIEGTTLEEPPAQALGGGLNSTLAAGTVTPAAPLPPGASVNLQFLLGVQRPGAYSFFVNVEAVAAAPAVANSKAGGARQKSGRVGK
jgi:CSLREA domain-containing protein